MNSKECPNCSSCSPENGATCRDCGFQFPVPISHADFIAESNRNYDLGRKHVKGELAPHLAALERLYKSCAGLRLRCEELQTALRGVMDDCHAVWLDTPAIKRAQNVCDKSPGKDLEENMKAMKAAENLLL